MEITVNQKKINFKNEITVSRLLSDLKISSENGIAVALNYAVVPKSKFVLTHLKQGDVVEIIHATAGG